MHVTRVERRIVDWLDQHKIGLFILIVSVIALWTRYVCLDMESRDWHMFLSGWFDQIKKGGGLKMIGAQVGDYNVIYQVIIALLTYLPFEPLHLYKAVSIVFDYVLAVGIRLLAMELKGKFRIYFALGYALTLFLPTCIFNSAMWGQCDSMYAAMLAFWFLFTLRKRHIVAFVFLGIAFALKLQTIFVLPFLIYHYVTRREFSILHGLIPLAFAIVPSILCGRHPLETFRIYLGQRPIMAASASTFPISGASGFRHRQVQLHWPGRLLCGHRAHGHQPAVRDAGTSCFPRRKASSTCSSGLCGPASSSCPRCTSATLCTSLRCSWWWLSCTTSGCSPWRRWWRLQRS